MKYEDFPRVNKLVNKLSTVVCEADAIRDDPNQSCLGVTFDGRYQGGDVLDAVRPVVLGLIQQKIDALADELRAAGLDVPGASLPKHVGPVTPFLVHEAFAHAPANYGHVAREEWIAAFLNRSILNPNMPLCDCCGDD